MTTDPACSAAEEGAGSGEQPEARRKKPATVTGPRRPNFEPKRQREAEMEKEKEKKKERRSNSRECSENTLHTVFHIPPTETATATTAATVRHNEE